MSENILIELGIIFVTTIISIYIYLKYNFSYWKRRGVEYVEPSLLFGNLTGPILGQENLCIAIKSIADQIKGPFGGGYMFMQPVMFFKDPALIKRVLIKDFDHFADRGFYVDEKNDPLTGSLLSLEGDRWRFMRNKLTPTFTSGKLKLMVENFAKHGQRLQGYLENCIKSNNNIIEARDIMSRYTIDTIVQIAFGIETDCINNPNEDFFKMGLRISEPPRMVFVKQILQFLAPQVLKVLKLKVTEQEVEDFIRSVTEQSLHLREEKNVVRRDFMQLIVQLRNSGNISPDKDWSTEISRGSAIFNYYNL